MRPRVIRATAVITGLLLLLALPSCGGKPERGELRDYESALESLMAEDIRVSASLKDLREDLFAANAKAEDQTRFAAETATPFYQRFRETAAAVPTRDPRLEAVHGKLQQYVDHRSRYLVSIETCLATAESDTMKTLVQATMAVQEARGELQGTAAGPLDREAQEALEVMNAFLDRVLEGYRQGKVDQAFVEKALEEQVIPRFTRLATRPEGDPGSAAVPVIRWAKAELAYFKVVAESLKVQGEAQAALRDSEQHWALAEELRTTYLEELTAYRESIR